MSGKTITRLFAPLVLVLGLVALGIAGPKKQGNDKGSGAVAQTGKADSDKQKGKQLTSAESHQPVDPSQYVGAETCKTCHEEQAKGYDQGPHWKTELNKHQRRGVAGLRGLPRARQGARRIGRSRQDHPLCIALA